MANAKEIRTQIKSIQNTRKITSAMEMVAASKMRKAQDRMKAARPYGEKMRQVISHLAHAHPEYRHGYLDPRDAKRVGYIVVTSDRGLCGPLNVNVFKTVVKDMKAWSDKGAAIDLVTVGTKGSAFFRRLGANITAQAEHLGDAPGVEDVIGPVNVMLQAYDEGRIDRLFLVFNDFVNTMTQSPRVEQLLPVESEELEEQSHHWDYIYEPDAKDVLDGLLQRYIESLVYQGLVENIACEQAARMIAMKSATDNAGSLIDELNLAYNKARQAAITQELSEIVAGAAAV
ncbi:MAG: F0F1 ATP synthase subunit gamma [Gammaproteobacteria bacterium]|nr:F0F1 ATP synthase subunit gamma [Gammaproteobacteria bacterium]MCP5138211.1 F0F1 ATP synthase subunit gamma [Gammaproteobacteria bacterium]